MSDILKKIKSSLKKEMSTGEMHHIAENLLHFLSGEHSEQEKKEAESLLAISEKKREENWEKDQQIANAIFHLFIQAKKTKALLQRLSPKQIKKNIDRLQQEFSALEKKAANRSYFLEEELENCFKMICRCAFYFRFDEAMLLDYASYEKNAAHLLKELEIAFLESSASSRLLWMQMPASFRSGIEKAGVEIFKKPFSKLDDEEKSYAVDVYYTDLQHLLLFAETFFYLSETKALYQFHKIPMRIKREFLQDSSQKNASIGELVMQYVRNLLFDAEES